MIWWLQRGPLISYLIPEPLYNDFGDCGGIFSCWALRIIRCTNQIPDPETPLPPSRKYVCFLNLRSSSNVWANPQRWITKKTKLLSEDQEVGRVGGLGKILCCKIIFDHSNFSDSWGFNVCAQNHEDVTKGDDSHALPINWSQKFAVVVSGKPKSEHYVPDTAKVPSNPDVRLHSGSNRGPGGYQPPALPTELRRPDICVVNVDLASFINHFWSKKQKNSPAGIWTRVSRVRAVYPDQLD